MGDHEPRGSNATRPTAGGDQRDDWRDEEITVVEKQGAKPAPEVIPPLARLLANQRDK